MSPDSFLQRVVTLANKTAKGLKGHFSEVQAIVSASEIVVAVWQDAREPKGVGTLLIKGQQTLRGIMADDETAKRRVAAIPCTSYEQAETLRQVVGERYLRH